MRGTQGDGIFVEVRTGDPRFGEPTIGVGFAQLPSGEVDLNEMISDLDAIAVESGVYNSRATITASHTSWGADGSVIRAVLEAGGGFVAESLIARLVQLVRKHGATRLAAPYRLDWTNAELVEHAQRMYCRGNGVMFRDATPTGIERAPASQTAKVSLRLPNGKSAAITIQMVNGIPVMVGEYTEL